jgi:flagellar biosynthesis protein FlhG
MRVFSITSGKGGVGKTSLVCNIARRLGQLGKKVLLIDADMGLANVDIVMGLAPQANLADLFFKDADLSSLLVSGPENVMVLPASSGVRELSQLSDEQVMKFLNAVDELESDFDIVLIDTGAGIGSNVLYFNAAAQEVLVVATPEPTSVTDAYAVIKVLSTVHKVKNFRLIVNQVESRKQSLKIYRYLTNVADEYLDVNIEYLGYVVSGPEVSQAVMQRQLFLDYAPDGAVSECIRGLVDDLLRQPPAETTTGNLQFFWRKLVQPGA